MQKTLMQSELIRLKRRSSFNEKMTCTRRVVKRKSTCTRRDVNRSETLRIDEDRALWEETKTNNVQSTLLVVEIAINAGAAKSVRLLRRSGVGRSKSEKLVGLRAANGGFIRVEGREVGVCSKRQEMQHEVLGCGC